MFRALVQVAGAIALCASALSAQQFLYDNTALPAQTIWTDGVEIIDVDDDGDNDIVFANGSSYGGAGTQGSQAQHLFLNDGAANFTAAHSQLNVANFNAKMVIAEDLDNDGDPDLAYASGSAGFTPELLLNDGTGNFTDVSATNLPALALRSFSIVGADVDNDGDVDLALSDGGTFDGIAAQARLLLNDGSADFTDVTATQMPADLYNCQDITFFDADGDLDADMGLTGKGASGKRARLYLNDGAGTFSIATGLDAVGGSLTYEADFADLDGDGDFDSVVQSLSGSSEGWARNDGNMNTAWVETTFSLPHGSDDNEMASLDYDMDGDLDVFVGSLSGGGERVYRNVSNVFTLLAGVISVQGDATLDLALGDLDGDGDADLVTAQGESGSFTDKVYINGGAADDAAPVIVETDVDLGLRANGTDTEAFLRVQLRDQLMDDGHDALDVTASTTGEGGGEIVTRAGAGLYRGSYIVPLGDTVATLSMNATDMNGNTVSTSLFSLDDAWEDLGNGKAGVSGVPLLVGEGFMVEGTLNALDLSNAAPSAIAALFTGLAAGNVSFKGGILVPFPVLLTITLGTNGSGALNLPFVLPALGSGVDLFFQYGIDDSAATFNVALSNAVQATTY